jgi:hypothetical protein
LLRALALVSLHSICPFVFIIIIAAALDNFFPRPLSSSPYTQLHALSSAVLSLLLRPSLIEKKIFVYLWWKRKK